MGGFTNNQVSAFSLLMLSNARMTLVYILFQRIPREQIIPEATAIIPWHFSAHRQEKFQPFATASFPLEYPMRLFSFFLLNLFFNNYYSLRIHEIQQHHQARSHSSLQAEGFDTDLPLSG